MKSTGSSKFVKSRPDSENDGFALAADKVDEGIYIVSEDYRIRFMNRVLIDLLGDHVGDVCYSALFKRDSICPWTVMNAIKEETCGVQELELPGTNKIFQVRSFGIELPDGSKAKIGVMKDITRTRRLQRKVKELDVRYEAIEDAADKAGLGISLLQDHRESEAVFRYANDAFCRITGYEAEELLRMNLGDLVKEDLREQVLDRYRRRKAGEIVNQSYELELRRKDGVAIFVMLSAAISLWKGSNATILFIRDVTERKRVQRALWQSQRLASIGRLAAEVAHEINNPLAVVLTYIRLLRKLARSELFTAERLDDVNRYLSTMEDEVSRSGKIVKSLLEFSRRGQIEFKENDVQEILRKTIDIVRHRCQLEGIKIHTSFARDLPPVVCDFKRMQQPFLGIIFNAMEAMPEGGTLSISTCLDETGEYVCVDISDEGTGIPKEDVEKIFEPFYSTKEEGKGVGLGLSVAYGIVEQHYGKIFVDSEMGKGTRFTIKLPAGDLPPTSRIKLLWMRSGGQSNE